MSDYVDKLNYLEETKDLIKSAIESKGVTVSSDDSFRDYAEKISEITGGGGTEIPRGTPLTRDDFPLSNAVKERRIAAPFTFYDYDGTVLGQYTKAEIDAMTSEDDFPTPIGSTEYPLTFVGWNWTLDELKAEPYGINVGAIYAHEEADTMPVCMYFKPEKEVTFDVGYKGTSWNYYHTVSIKDMNTGEFVYSELNPQVVTTVTLPAGHYMLGLYLKPGSKDLSAALFNINEKGSTVKAPDDLNIQLTCYGSKFSQYNNEPHCSPLFRTTSTFPTPPKVKAACYNTIYIGRGSWDSVDYLTIPRGNQVGYNWSKKISIAGSNPSSPRAYFYDIDELLLPNSYNSDSVSIYGGEIEEVYAPNGSIGLGSDSNTKYAYIEDGVKSVSVFTNSLIEELYIPDGCRIGDIGVEGKNIKKIRLPEDITSLSKMPIQIKELYIPDSVTTLKAGAFLSCKGLKQLYIPDSVKNIEEKAFASTLLTADTLRLPKDAVISTKAVFGNMPIIKQFKDISFKPSDTEYSLYAGCKYLTGEIIVPEGVVTLKGDSMPAGHTNDFHPIAAFCDCHNITKVVLPSSLQTIGQYAFYNCNQLKEVNIPENITVLNTSTFHYCKRLEKITLPQSLTTIKGKCFYNCDSLEEITIPDGVTSLGSGYTDGEIFNYCYALKKVTLSNNLKSIGSSCFNYCKSLTTITIPSTVTDMNAGSIFAYCEKLTEYHMKPTTPPTLNSSTFGYSSALPNTAAKIYVPYSDDHSILAAYQSATNWSKFAAYMVEEERPSQEEGL